MRFVPTVVLGVAILLCGTAGAAPLSCDMQRTLHRVAAMARDAGMPRSRTQESLEKDGDLSKQEISKILNAAYVTGDGVPPDELGQAAYDACKGVKKAAPAPESSKTAALDCYDVGYRYAHTATNPMNGKPTNPAWDFVVPARCKANSKLNEGIQAGTSAAANAQGSKR